MVKLKMKISTMKISTGMKTENVMDCPSKKRQYVSYQEAYDKLEELKTKNSNGRNGKEFRIYECNVCGWFHLTHTVKDSLKPKSLFLKTEETIKRCRRILKRGEK